MSDRPMTAPLTASPSDALAVAQSFHQALLDRDAARAETEAVRKDVRAYEMTMRAIEAISQREAAERDALRALAAELVEGLERLLAVIDSAGLLNLSHGVQLGQTAWYVKAYDATEHLRTLGIRARALGIGGERDRE